MSVITINHIVISMLNFYHCSDNAALNFPMSLGTKHAYRASDVVFEVSMVVVLINTNRL